MEETRRFARRLDTEGVRDVACTSHIKRAHFPDIDIHELAGRREAAQSVLGISDKVARVFQGMLLFFVLGCDTLILYRIRIVTGLGAPRTEEAH